MFGVSLMLDMYDCRPGACNDLGLHYRFLEELVERIGMTKMSAPIVIYAPRVVRDGKLVEEYPDKEGVSGWVPLIESGIQIHSLEPTRFAALDLFTCGKLDPEAVVSYAREVFGFVSHDRYFLERGTRYHP